MAIDFIITDAGRAAVLNSHQNGWGPVEITEIALGSGSWTPTPAATALQSEIKRLTTVAGGASSPTTLHVNGADRSSDDYEAFEVGLYLSSGVLFAIVSQPIAIVSKSTSSSAYVSADVEMTGQVSPDMVVFGDTNFVWNSATETVEGLVELATSTEVENATGTGVVTAANSAVFARAGESADVHTASGLKSGIYTSSASGFDGQFAVRATKPSGKSLALVATEGTYTGELAISVQDTPSGSWVEKYTFRDDAANDARYTQTSNNLSDLASASTARTNLGLAYATQVQAQDGVNNATSMTPLRTADAITAQRPYSSQAQAQAGTDNATVMTPLRTKEAVDTHRPISVALTTGRINMQRQSGSGPSMAQQFGTGVTNFGSTVVTASVSFGQNFSATPVVTITPTLNTEAGVITNVSVTFASLTVTFKCDVAPTSGISFNWLAIGTVT